MDKTQWKLASTAIHCISMLALTVLAAPLAAQQQETTAFTGVTVIPMDRERAVPDQTVVVQGGRIIAAGPTASTAVPANATRIDGAGKFLIPGLAEMHGHVPAVSPGSRFAEDVLFLYIAAGATTVRGMQGNISQLDLRRRVEAGELIGPRLVLSTPPLSGDRGADDAEQFIRNGKSQGFDLVKVHEGLSLETYDRIATTAVELNMQWGGHVSDNVGLHHALERKQTTVDHLDNYVIEMLHDPTAGVREDNVDRTRISDLARETKQAGVAVVPTMALWEVILGAHDPTTMMDRPELRYMPRRTVEGWVTNVRGRMANTDPAAARLEAQLRLLMLKALNDAGVQILLGTDAPQIFSVPGFSLDREVVSMASAGMTPWQILYSGTKAVATHFGWEDTGTIEPGKRADLVLLDANPLTDIANIRRRAGVMVNGRWLSRENIADRLEEIAARVAG